MARQEPAAVGFVGLGNMGWPMARHLRQGGVDLVLFDARVERAARFAEQHGGRVAPDLAALARASEVVITMLPDGRDGARGGARDAGGAGPGRGLARAAASWST